MLGGALGEELGVGLLGAICLTFLALPILGAELLVLPQLLRVGALVLHKVTILPTLIVVVRIDLRGVHHGTVAPLSRRVVAPGAWVVPGASSSIVTQTLLSRLGLSLGVGLSRLAPLIISTPVLEEQVDIVIVLLLRGATMTLVVLCRILKQLQAMRGITRGIGLEG